MFDVEGATEDRGTSSGLRMIGSREDLFKRPVTFQRHLVEKAQRSKSRWVPDSSR